MELTKDKVPMICPLAKSDDFVCPAVNSSGECTVYTNDGILAKQRIGTCHFKEMRRPTVEKKRGFVNPLKASKRKIKSGSVETS